MQLLDATVCIWQQHILWAQHVRSWELACMQALVPECCPSAATHPAAAEIMWVCSTALLAGFTVKAFK